MFDDDDDLRTPEEREADEADERQVWEMFHLDRQLDDEQALLQRVADADPVGYVWFGQDSDTWLDERLGGARDGEDRK